MTRQWPNWEKPSSKGSCTIAFRILKVEIRVLHRDNLISVVYLTSCLILSFISTSIRPRFAHPACPLFFRLISLAQLSFLVSTPCSFVHSGFKYFLVHPTLWTRGLKLWKRVLRHSLPRTVQIFSKTKYVRCNWNVNSKVSKIVTC